MTIMPWTGPGSNPEMPWGGGLLGRRRRGIFGSGGNQSMPMAAVPVEEAQKPKFFGEGGAGRNIAGHLGDALLQMAQMQPIYQPMVQQRQHQRYVEQRDAAQRELDMADFRTKQQIEAQYAKPAAPYRWESNNGSLMEIGPDGQPKMVYEDPTPKINWVRADNGDGTFTMVPMGPNGPIGGQQASPAVPTEPKGKLTPYKGGQTASPSGNF